MSKDFVIITGANRGIGLALAKEIITPTTSLISVQRSEDAKELEAFTSERGVEFQIVRVDLSDIDSLEDVIVNGVLSKINKDDANSVTLIQNAGIAFTAKCGEQDFKLVNQLLQINTVAPTLITELFVRHIQSWPIEKKIMYISSGAGRKVYEGWSSYGSSKAANEHFVKILHAEQAKRTYPIFACAYGPGVVQTRMQDQINESDSDVPIVARLKEMKKAGTSFTPEKAAQIAIKFLRSPEFATKVTEDAYNLV
eukprot:CAMPEP_0168591944 /NCGR_PEP_ID=MMETSP0420-20121227/7422_1 /TAXON_ID=498008 /ORGANISM="Pessonella sp." /LENGTH=253 /DNA_ID=CAMNT_0008627805 /DNA_START=16 /DNA_END=777 /DNA_ORIENTATION=-